MIKIKYYFVQLFNNSLKDILDIIKYYYIYKYTCNKVIKNLLMYYIWINGRYKNFADKNSHT